MLRSLDTHGEESIAEAADWLGTTIGAIRQALAYYGAFSTEIDNEIEANRQAADSARPPGRFNNASSADESSRYSVP